MIGRQRLAEQREAIVAWWVDPVKLLVFFMLPFYVFLYLTPSILGRGALQLRSVVYFDEWYFLLGLAFFVVMILGCVMGRMIIPRPPRPGAQQNDISEIYLEVLAILTILAYLIWFRGFVMRPWLLLRVFTGGEGAYLSRAANPTIGGITTMTQIGIAYVILFLDRIWGSARPDVNRRLYWYFFIIFGLACFRVYVWAERLALIELVVPIAVLYFVHRRDSRSVLYKAAAWLGPVAGIAALVVYFGVTEFYRSWSAHYYTEGASFSTFAGRRLLTYYYTALNNGAGMLELLEWPTYQFQYVLMWVYRFPAMIGPIFRFTLDVEDQGWPFLVRHADSEFNNLAPVFTVFYDAGVAGGLAIALLWGGLVGYCYRSAVEGRGLGKLLYPIMYISILEVMRILYLGEPRAFPALLVIVVGHYLARRRAVAPEVSHVHLRGGRHRVVGRRPWFELWRSAGKKT